MSTNLPVNNQFNNIKSTEINSDNGRLNELRADELRQQYATDVHRTVSPLRKSHEMLENLPVMNQSSNQFLKRNSSLQSAQAPKRRIIRNISSNEPLHYEGEPVIDKSKILLLDRRGKHSRHTSQNILRRSSENRSGQRSQNSLHKRSATFNKATDDHLHT